jgi:ADP-ribose pyrophosphatase
MSELPPFAASPGFQDSAATDPLAEQTLASRIAYEGVFLRLLEDRVRCPDGHIALREYLKHPGAVMIVPLLPNGDAVLERQYRHPLGRSFIEFPAGKVDPGESLQQCAERELLEETGYRAHRWTHLGGFHNAIGYSDEKIEVFVAEELVAGPARTDAGEVLELFTAPWDRVMNWARDGTITDVKTIVGAYWADDHRRGKSKSKSPAS